MLAHRAHSASVFRGYQGSRRLRGSSPFSDVPAGVWVAEAVAWMAEAGLTTGTVAGRFSPGQFVTRGEAVTFLWRLAGSPHPSSLATSFVDVPDVAFYRRAVAWAVENGITQGLNDFIFGGGFWIDRAQAVTFLHRYELRFGALVGSST